MAVYATTTKVIIHSIPDGSADSVSDSYAKEVNDYVKTIEVGDIVNIHSVSRGSTMITTIVHQNS